LREINNNEGIQPFYITEKGFRYKIGK